MCLLQDDSSLAGHVGERAVRGTDGDESLMAGDESLTAPDPDDGAESVDDLEGGEQAEAVGQAGRCGLSRPGRPALGSRCWHCARQQHSCG